MGNREYDFQKLKAICEITLENYVYMKKRIEFKDSFSKFVLTYYSIFLIILGITGNYFESFDKKLGEYTGILFSIVLLAYSLINSSAKYEIRILQIEKAINELKTLKRDNEISENEFKKKYDIIVNNTEMRSDRDFYRTVKSMYRKKGENLSTFYFDLKVKNTNEELKKYRGDLDGSYQIILNFCEKIVIFITITIPLVLLIFITLKK